MKTWDYNPGDEVAQDDLDEMLYSRHVELENLEDLTTQRGTPIPALFNIFYKFIQNPSTVSIETFKRMVDTDDTIGSGVEFLVMCLAARLGRYQHPNEEVTKFVNDALNKVQGGWTNAIKEMLSATWAGFSCSEKVWANDQIGFIIKKFVPMPPQTILFETERTGELTPDGILQYQRNYNPALMSNGPGYMYGFSWSLNSGINTRPDPAAKLGDLPFPLRTANSYSYLSIRIPVKKVVHYSFDAQGKFGNPYGRSLLRKAYKFYVMKDSFLNMLAIALDRKGTPLTIVYADATAPIQKAGPNGEMNPQAARGNKAEFVRADYEAKRAFEKIHNDTVIVLPGKKGQVFDHEFVNQQSNASDFLAAIDMCNKSIMRALLVPSLIFTNGDGTGSFALGQEHAKTFDKILDSMLGGFKQVLIDEVVQELIRYNFPESVWGKDGFGDFSKRELSMDEISKELEVVEKAVNIGAVDMNDLNDLNKIRDKMDFEPLTKVPERAQDIGGEEGGIEGKDPHEEVNDGGEDGDGDEPKNEKEESKEKKLRRLSELFKGPRIVTVGLISGDEILVGKRRDNGKWTNPGGHMDDVDIDDMHAAIREVLEETGIKISRSNMKSVFSGKLVGYKGKDFQLSGFIAEIDKVEATNKNDPDDEFEEIKWVKIHPKTTELLPENRHVKDDVILAHLFKEE